jgi:hypothetical protein
MRSRKNSAAGRAPARRSRVAAVAAMVPLAISMIPAGARLAQPSTPAAQPPAAVLPTTTSRAARRAPAKEFSVPVANLREWAGAVVTTLEDVTITGSSKVHKPEADCEIHLGAHTPAYRGDPEGIVLEPMNACTEPFPGKSEHKNADWTNFAKKITGTAVTAVGVPRIWPEHLSGGGGPSNPDHAVELHPLTAVVSDGQTFDFAPNVFAGEYRGGVSEPTALSIVQKTAVSVARNGDSADVSFHGGRIGNFTVLNLVIDRDSIADDGAGSFRMNGEVVVDDSTTVQVRIVTAKGSPINDEMQKIRSGRRRQVSMDGALVLFSLSPEALLAAADRSNGDTVVVDRPLQLILYGVPDPQ